MHIRTKGGGIILGARDFALLRGLYESRVATIVHLARIYFAGRSEMAKKRVQKLKEAGLIRAMSRSRFERSCLFITTRGIGLLRRTGALRRYEGIRLPPNVKRTQVAESTLAHELAVMDVKSAFHLGAQAAQCEVVAFSTWPALNQFVSHRGMVKPDAFVRLKGYSREGASAETRFYLELDRSTESCRVLVERAHAYRACRLSTRCVAPQTWDTARSEHRFTVLIVVPSVSRLKNLARQLLASNPPVRSLVWIATKEDVVSDPFGPIWVRPRDLGSEGAPSTAQGSGSLRRLRLEEA